MRSVEFFRWVALYDLINDIPEHPSNDKDEDAIPGQLEASIGVDADTSKDPGVEE